MSSTLFTPQRRLIASGLTVLFAAVGLGAGAAAQAPSVVVSFPTPIPHNETYSAPWQSAVSNRGDFLLFDFKTQGLYEYPVGGGPEITIAGPEVIAGDYTNSGIAVDPRNNNIYLNNNYNGGLLEFPFDAKTGMWDLPSVVVANNLGGNIGGNCGNYFQATGLSVNDNGVIAVGTEGGCGVTIFTVPIDASGVFGNATPIVSNLNNRPKTVAIDDAGNISFNEDTVTGNGVLFIPTGTTGLNGETSILKIFSTPTKNDANGNPIVGNNVQGVTVDTAGNLYIADQNLGLFLVPLQLGSPNTAQQTLLSPALANGGPSIDSARGTVFMTLSSNIVVDKSTTVDQSTMIKDVAKIYLNRTELFTNAIGSTPTASLVTYRFDNTTTPYNFSLVQSGKAFALGDISKCGVVISTDNLNNPTHTAIKYTPGQTCALPVTFTPTTVGEASATLLMLDTKGDILNASILHGTGLGSDATISPAVESRTLSGLKAPTQVAIDAVGTLYIADSGKVLQYAAGASTGVSVGTALTAPTGVAVDGSGNLFIADSGNLLEVPNSAKGLNAAGQVTLKSGLGKNTRLAADAIGDVFIADPDNQRVVRLRNIALPTATETDTAGFAQASAIAADGLGDFYVANGANLVAVTSANTTTLSNSLSGANGLAVDASGSVYVTSTSQTVRIPSIGGTLTPANQVVLATGVTKPTSVAVDVSGNAYITDAAAGNVDVISVNGALNLGMLATPASTSTGTVLVSNDGNQPLTITAFSTTADYSVTSTTCTNGPVAVGASCSATVTFSPGPGGQGTLTGQLTATSNAINTPVAINLTGVGAKLAASTTTFTATTPTVTSASVVVKVAPTTGTTPVPTGIVTVTVSATGYPDVVLAKPLVNGSATFTETAISAGMDSFTVSYGGDRIYGRSTATSTVTVAPGSISLTQPLASTVPQYILSNGTGSAEPYDGSQQTYYFVYQMVIKTANGAPLVGVPQYDTQNRLTGYDYGSVTFAQATGCAPVKVQGDGTVMFAASCVNIDTTNNQIVNLVTPYTLTPTYSGANYSSVTGTSFSFTAIRNPSVVITTSPTSLTVKSGSSTVANVTLTSLLGYGVTGVQSNLNNYSLPVELGCTGLPAHAACSFTYPTPDPSDVNSTDVTPTLPGTAVMTITTNLPVGTTASSRTQQTATFLALTGLGLLGLAFSRKKRLSRSFGTLACLLLMAGVAAGLSSCGTDNINPNPVLNTPAGTYTITITAKQTGSKLVPNPNGVGAPVPVSGSGNQMSILFTMPLTVQ